MHRDLQCSNVWWVRPHSVFTWWPLSFHSLLHSESVKFSSARGTTFCTKTDMQNLIRSARLNWESFNKWQTDSEVLRKFLQFWEWRLPLPISTMGCSRCGKFLHRLFCKNHIYGKHHHNRIIYKLSEPPHLNILPIISLFTSSWIELTESELPRASIRNALWFLFLWM